MLQNWLVNPTGKVDSWIEVDLLQEHLNFWTKVSTLTRTVSISRTFRTQNIYKAHGSNASWEWLAMVSPCIELLRRLATQINHDLGSHQGSKHTSPDLTLDIEELMKSLADHRVYTVEAGRIIDDESDNPCVPNAVGLGWTQLAGPLADFNTQLRRLQARCHMKPLVGQPYVTSNPEARPSSTTRSPNLSAQADPAAPATETNPTPPSQTHPSSPRLEATTSALAPASLLPVSHDDDDDEALYWGEDEDFELPDEETSIFSFDTAADVALDMDDVSTLNE